MLSITGKNLSVMAPCMRGGCSEAGMSELKAWRCHSGTADIPTQRLVLSDMCKHTTGAKASHSVPCNIMELGAYVDSGSRGTVDVVF